MRKLVGFLILLFLCQYGMAQMARYSHELSFSEHHFIDTVSIEWEGGQVYVPVVMGQKCYRFLFDTGAAQAVVYADTPIEGCVPAGQIRSHDAVGTVGIVPMVLLPPYKLGHLVVSGCQATVQQRPVSKRPVDGILGFNLINSGLSLKIDVRNRWLILTDIKNFFNREQGFETRYLLKYHVPYLQVSPFGSYSELTLFDTGSRSLYVMNRQSFDASVKKEGDALDSLIEGRVVGRHSIGHSGVEPLSEVVFLHLDNLRMGDVSFTDLHTLTTQGESHLGAGVLTHGAVIFNPRKRRIRFQPYNQHPKVCIGNQQLDIAFVSEDGMPCVGLVWPLGEPYRLGFRQGDIIVKIDDSNVNSFSQFVSWPFLIGREYRFTVKSSNGQMHEIRWTRLPFKSKNIKK